MFAFKCKRETIACAVTGNCDASFQSYGLIYIKQQTKEITNKFNNNLKVRNNEVNRYVILYNDDTKDYNKNTQNKKRE